MSKRFLLSLLAAVAVNASCSFGGLSSGGAMNREAYRQKMAAESLSLARTTDTTYRRRMDDFMRRTLAVPIDSLARIYVALGKVPDVVKPEVLRASTCEQLHVIRKYGVAAFLRADRRIADSLAGAGVDVRRNFERAESLPYPQLTNDPRGCDDATRALPLLPDSINGAPQRTRPEPAKS